LPLREIIPIVSYPRLTGRIVNVTVILRPSFKAAALRIAIPISLGSVRIRSWYVVIISFQPAVIVIAGVVRITIIICPSFKTIVIVGSNTTRIIIVSPHHIVTAIISTESVVRIVPVITLKTAGCNITTAITFPAHIRTIDTHFIIPEGSTSRCVGLTETNRVDPTGISFRVITTGT